MQATIKKYLELQELYRFAIDAKYVHGVDSLNDFTHEQHYIGYLILHNEELVSEMESDKIFCGNDIRFEILTVCKILKERYKILLHIKDVSFLGDVCRYLVKM